MAEKATVMINQTFYSTDELNEFINGIRLSIKELRKDNLWRRDRKAAARMMQLERLEKKVEYDLIYNSCL